MIAGILALLIVLVFLSYLFLIMPNLSNPADMEALRTSYAHRGLWNEHVPENSMAAFARAVQKGYGIELDVQLSKDKKVVVFHDESLKRMCGVDRTVGELTVAELKSLRLKDSDQTIPLLAEVLAMVGGRVPLMIEVKGIEVKVALCVRLAKMLDAYRGAFSVISFNPRILSWFKSYRPCYARGQLVTNSKKKTRRGSRIANFFLTHMMLNFLSRPDFISVRKDLCRRPSIFLMIRVFRLQGFAWTVKTSEEWRACRRLKMLCVFEKIEPKRIQRKDV